jgi:uncharacterized short protein YbdD (DUF466 family)
VAALPSNSKPFRNWLRLIWQGVRHVSGDDAYERYLAHHRLHHADAVPLDRAAWFRHEQNRKWDGIRRCC